MILKNLFLFIIIVENILSQEARNQIDIKLDVEVTGQITQDNGLIYYKLTIPENYANKDKDLVIRIKENDMADEGKDEFSDADIYVSKTNPFPENPQNSKWYSERYGEDLLSIPKADVFAGEVFYIGAFCEKKCKYSLLAKLEEEHEIFEGTMYRAFIKKKDSISYKFKAKDTDYNELEIVAFSPHISNFRIYVQKNETPSFQKSILAIPSWVGGYSVNIIKGTNDYCKSCYYYIVFDAPIVDASILFYVKYEETITLVRSSEPVFSTLKPFRKHCYKYSIPDNKNTDNLLIQLMLFSGSVTLSTKAWIMPDQGAETSYYYIHSEKVIKISPADRKRDNKESGEYFFCLFTTEYTSYILKAFFEKEIEETQRFSYLYRGKELEGFLPPDKATRYRILEFDAKSDISVSMAIKSGSPKLYGYICPNIRECRFSKNRVDQEIAAGKMILAEKDSLNYKMTILNKDNICHKNLEKEDSLQNEMNSLPCATLVVVVCEGAQDCEYTLRTVRDIYPILLKPKKSHYQILPYDEYDDYEILIDDENVTDLNVILNTITGDADMKLYYKGTPGEDSRNITVAISENEPYLPDVIRITKEMLSKPNLKGIYYIKVYGSSFSSYSIYYYTKNSANAGNNNAVPSDTNVELQTGHIIKDFFLSNTKYKVYAYNPRLFTNSDIRITLTPDRSDYSIHVFNDLTKLKYNETDVYNKISGSLWSSLYNDEVIIRKSDQNYKKDGTYYIVISKRYDLIDNTYNSTALVGNHIPSYWLGVTTELSPFLLYEGVPNSALLDDNYNNQTYWYTHTNVNDTFHLSVNVFFGRVNIYADFKKMSDNDINSSDMPILETSVDTGYYSISSEILKARCRQGNNCGIYIMIKKNSTYDTSYLVVAKSHQNRPVMLTASKVRSEGMLAGEVRKFYMIIEKKKATALFVSFLTGYGEVYVNIAKSYENFRKADYPTKEKFDYISNDSYTGKIISLSEKAFDNCDPCQIFISVYGYNLGFSQHDIEFSIAVYNSFKKINQNQPLKGRINQGELQYFSVNFGKKVDNIYVSLTNMDGDVDMFMEYGYKLPLFENSTWFSSSPYNEFIEFNKDHNFFLTNKINDISGNYTLMLYGYTNSTYTLYLTSHPNKIIPISEFSPASCKAKAGDFCYFRYEDLYENINHNNLTDINMIITTDYLVGSGAIFSKLYNAANYEILNDFPTKTNNDYNSINTNSRNILKLVIDKNDKKLNRNSMLLVSVECKDDCFFDLNILQMFDSDVRYIDLFRENIFYISKKSETQTSVLIYYNYMKKDLMYSLYSYEGKADIKIYTNNTNYNSSLNKYEFKIEEINKFEIDYNNKPSYHNTIDSSKIDINFKNIYFAIYPKTDFCFHVRVAYETEWTKVKIGKINTFLISSDKKNFYGYFDMMDEYDYVVVSLTCKTKGVMAYLNIRNHIIDKNQKPQDNNNPYDYLIPDAQNAEFSGNTDSILNSASLKVPRLQRDQMAGKFVRVLMSVSAFNFNFFSNSTTDYQVDILVTPSIKGKSGVTAEQNKFIFTEFTGDSTDYKTFDLAKRMAEDDIMIIEISTCIGDIEYRISDKLNFYEYDYVSVDHTLDSDSGRYLIKIDLNKYKSNNFYLILKPKDGPNKDCSIKNGKYICTEKTTSMFYYFTSKQDLYFQSFANNRGTIEVMDISSDSVNIKWSQVLLKDPKNIISFKIAPANFIVFISENIFDYNHMESICYLSKMKMNNTINIIYNEDGSTATLKGLKAGNKYFVNVLAKNPDTNEIIAYKPIEVLPIWSFPITIVVIIVILLFVFAFLAYFFYRKFIVTKEILKYETNDVRNMSQIPRSQNELKNLAKTSSAQKYANLSERSEII